jgi:hypothetical protein
MTREQWLTTRSVTFPKQVVDLAQVVFNGEKEAVDQLHDALLDAGLDSLAEHFADVNPDLIEEDCEWTFPWSNEHAGKRRGPGQCWALLMLLGRLKRRRELLGTPTASAWCGISPPQFRKLARQLQLEPENWHANPHYSSGPSCPLWAPEAILAIPAEAIQKIKERARGTRVGG